jgi:hypothetical protein
MSQRGLAHAWIGLDKNNASVAFTGGCEPAAQIGKFRLSPEESIAIHCHEL